MKLPNPSYPALRSMRPGEVRAFAGGQKNRQAVTTIQTKAGGKFTQAAAILVSPHADWVQDVTLVTCIEPTRPSSRERTTLKKVAQEAAKQAAKQAASKALKEMRARVTATLRELGEHRYTIEPNRE